MEDQKRVKTAKQPQRLNPLEAAENEQGKVIKAMIFDLDGTVVDSIAQDYTAWKKAFETFDVNFPYEDYVKLSGAKGIDIVAEYLDISEEAQQDLVRKKNDYFFELSEKQGLEMMPHMEELLSQIKALSLKTAAATGGSRYKVDFVLKSLHRTRYFDAVVTSDDLTKGKPDPEIFLTAAKKLGVKPEEALVWEDATLGVQAAKNGGFKCVAITTTQKGGKEGLENADLILDSFENVKIEEILKALS